MLVVPREKQNAVFEAMKDYREMPFMFERSGKRMAQRAERVALRAESTGVRLFLMIEGILLGSRRHTQTGTDVFSAILAEEK